MTWKYNSDEDNHFINMFLENFLNYQIEYENLKASDVDACLKKYVPQC